MSLTEEFPHLPVNRFACEKQKDLLSHQLALSWFYPQHKQVYYQSLINVWNAFYRIASSIAIMQNQLSADGCFASVS